MEQQWQETLERKFPKRYSYISFRTERGGGFVFNPHLYNEHRVDDVCAGVVALSDGSRSIAEIITVVSRWHHLPKDEAGRRVFLAFRELEKNFAIHFAESRSQGQAPHSGREGAHRNCTGMHAPFPAPRSVIWDITYRCNLRCRHCLIDKAGPVNEMGLADAKKILDLLKRIKVFTITFSGGEPLLRMDIFDILQYAADLHFGLRLNSNGLLLDRETIARLGETGVYCYQVSLDGTRPTHDAIRGRKGSYKRAVEALKTASSEGYFTIMSMTLMRQNCHELQAMMDMAASLGVSTFKINGFVPTGRGKTHADDLSIPREEVHALCRFIADIKPEYEKKFMLQWDALYPWLLTSPVFSPRTEKTADYSPPVRCSAGHSNLVVSPDGTAYPCPYLTAFPLGNLLTNPFEEIWSTGTQQILARFRSLRQRDLTGKCKDCAYVPDYCNGGCRAMAYTVSGNFLAEDPACWKAGGNARAERPEPADPG